MAALTITSGPEQGRRVECDRELVIGRGEVDIVLADEQASRRHTVVRPVADGLQVEDLGSLNGTFVDGERISGPVTVSRDATLRVGETIFSVEVPRPEPGEAPLGATRIAAPPLDATTVRTKPPLPPPGGVVPTPPPVGAPAGGPPAGYPPGGPPGGFPPGGPPGGFPPGGPPGGGPPPGLPRIARLVMKTPLKRLLKRRHGP